MKRQFLRTKGLLLAVLCAGAFSAQAASQLSDWELGETLVGDKVSMSDLKGQVVVFEYWGTR